MRTILVFDDDGEPRSLFRAIFTRDNYEGVTADTLAAAGTILRDVGIDPVICDVFLPDGKAFTFDKNLFRPPFSLFLSGYPDSFIEHVAGERTSFAVNPVNLTYLLTKVAGMIGSGRMIRRTP